MKVVVFGAGGFLGGWIAEELSERPDIETLVCVRRWASAVRLARRGLDVRQADLEDASQLFALLEGAHAVINASMPAPSREPELVSGLHRMCEQAGVTRFVQFSSAAVYGDRTGVVSENMPITPNDDYSRGKATMEQSLTDAAIGSGNSVFILRPSIVYGPFSEGWTVRYVERIAKGHWRGLGKIGEGTCNLIHASDAARAAIAAVTASAPSGKYVLNLNGPDTLTWNEYIERLGDALGTPNRTVPSVLPFRAMAAGARIMRAGAAVPFVKAFYRRSAGVTRAAMKNAKEVTGLYPSTSELKLLGRKVRYTAELAKPALGIQPEMSLEEGLRGSVAWCRLHGIV